MSLPANLKAIRLRRSMTQEVLAEALNVSQATVARWERGERPISLKVLGKLADVLGVETVELFEAAAPAPPAPPAAPAGFASPPMEFVQPPGVSDLPRDLPVMGSVLGADLDIGGDGEGGVNVERLELDACDPIDFVKRPAGMRGNQTAYALYVQGYSMSPRLEQGDLIYVDTRRPPASGDDVVVQLFADEGDGHAVMTAMVKRLVRRSSQFVELEQFSPALRFKIAVNRVHAVHRVVRLAELLGI